MIESTDHARVHFVGGFTELDNPTEKSMKFRAYKAAVLICTGLVFGIFPGCVEVWILNLATPFLLNQ